MKSYVRDVIALGLASACVVLGSMGAALNEKRSEQVPSKVINADKMQSVSETGAPDTDTHDSPSTSPNLDGATASSWEGEAPPAQLEVPQSDSATEAVNSSALYVIPWQVVSAGGETSTSPSYAAHQTLGQEAIGSTASALYSSGQGYWYGAPTNAGPPVCACDCHADPAPISFCDGVQDVLDVVQTVNVAFRGAASILDPSATCPYETTDVDCTGTTDVLDVVKMVNVAFRGFVPSAQFCSPCP